MAGRLVDRWILIGGTAAMAHHGALQAALASEEPKSRDSDRHPFRLRPDPMAAVVVAAWLNLALLELAHGRVGRRFPQRHGHAADRLAAMAIIVLEIAVGMVLLEALGGTAMFPQLVRLERQRRLRLLEIVTLATALVVLASIEAALALTGDETARRVDRELMASLAGAAPSEAAQSARRAPRATPRPRSASSFPSRSPSWVSPS